MGLFDEKFLKVQGDGSYQAVPNGDQLITILFDEAFPDTTYIAVATLECNDILSTESQFIRILVTNKTVNGFDVVLSTPAPSANYVVNWIARDSDI